MQGTLDELAHDWTQIEAFLDDPASFADELDITEEARLALIARDVRALAALGFGDESSIEIYMSTGHTSGGCTKGCGIPNIETILTRVS
jgi:hypothetical protein